MRSLLLGIDTGGTYTDAVLVDREGSAGPEVVASAKALTTRHDLAIGIGAAVDEVLALSHAKPSEVKLCSLSTTLATNALVEGHGGLVALVAVGFSDGDLARAGLADALGSDIVIRIGGGHDAHGLELEPLDLQALSKALELLDKAPLGFAVVSQFGVRNPSHELAVKAMILDKTDTPVTCSHELTAKLNGPRRALTSLLNARLIPLIGSLLGAASKLMDERGITAPIMVVRGDGTLLSVDIARNRPIETILSGPAASVIGASFLTDVTDAIVADIGGTTTDIAILRDGKPRLDTEGATVGGHRTMVEAVAMRTHGLGGDSLVWVDDAGSATRLRLGPGRVIPLSILAAEHPQVVADLRRQAAADFARERDGQFALIVRPDATVESDDRTHELMAAMAAGPQPLNEILTTKRHELTLDRLVRSGVALRGGFTPTDACHVLGLHSDYSVEAAELGAKLFARQKDRRSEMVGSSITGLAQRVVDLVIKTSAELVLEAALASDGFAESGLAQHRIAQAALDGHSNMVQVSISVSVPVVGLGASAVTYYPAVARMLSAQSVLSPYSGVANAVGAVVGQVAITERATINPLKNGRFRAHAGNEQADFDTSDDAAAHATEVLSRQTTALAVKAGAVDPSVEVQRDDTVVRASGTDLFVESIVTVTASGRPRLG